MKLIYARRLTAKVMHYRRRFTVARAECSINYIQLIHIIIIRSICTVEYPRRLRDGPQIVSTEMISREEGSLEAVLARQTESRRSHSKRPESFRF